MLISQEQIVDTPIFFSEGLSDLVECVSNLKFTKHGIRISKVPLAQKKRAKSNEVFRVRTANSAQAAQRKNTF